VIGEGRIQGGKPFAEEDRFDPTGDALMATQADEFEPEWRVVEGLILLALQPRMRACERRHRVSMVARLTVWVRGVPGSSWIVTSSAINPRGLEAHGEVRLRCRRTYRPDRVLFRLESIYPNLDAETGFTGFSMSGDLLIGSNEVTVRPGFCIGEYNKRKWIGWV
jgi:hypothetical protein